MAERPSVGVLLVAERMMGSRCWPHSGSRTAPHLLHSFASVVVAAAVLLLPCWFVLLFLTMAQSPPRLLLPQASLPASTLSSRLQSNTSPTPTVSAAQ